MQTYLGGNAVTLVIPLVDSAGEPVTATAVSYRVIDQDELEVVAKTAADFTVGNETVEITVSALLNELPVDTMRAMRVVELYMTTAEGVVKAEQGYFIEAEEVLVEGVNSFQGYSKAVYLSYEIPNLPNWANAEKRERIAAMIAARRNIGQLRFRYVFQDDQDSISASVGISDITLATPEQWAALPKEFRDAVTRAQIIEADFVMTPNESLYGFRRDGLMSMTVGEAKQFFRPAKQLEGVVSNRTMKELAKYIQSGVRVARG